MMYEGETGVERLVTTSGRNVWVVGDHAECVVIDPAGSTQSILESTGNRALRAILSTTVLPAQIPVETELAAATDAPIFLHEHDLVAWRRADVARMPDRYVLDGMTLDLAGVHLVAIHTPGITPGGLSWHVPALSVVFTGDSLGAGGPGLVGLPGSDYDTLVASIREGLFMLATDTVVHPGSGGDTRIGTQRWDRRLWG